jgi:hypothetical protein
MKKIFIRSPYFIEVDESGQSNAKIEIFLWNKGFSEPATPNYTLTKNIASATQNLIAWNVSNFAKDFIKPVSPINVSVPTEEDTACWCYMKVVRYSDDNELDDETFVCLNGYTQYLNGYNQSTNNAVIPLLNNGIKQLHNNYINCWIDDNTGNTYIWNWGDSESDIDSTGSLFKLPLANSNDNYLYITNPSIDTFFNIISEEICEPIYTPIVCTFINRYGGWQYLTFFKANSSSIDVTSKNYNLLPSSIDYNTSQGQKRIFNPQGKQKIKCNTGWVDENYFELIQDLLLSEVVLLGSKPAIVKSQSSDIKTHLKDKNINYEIEFEFNYGLINDVI